MSKGKVRFKASGRRAILTRPDEVHIDETDGWRLVEVLEWKRDGWVNLKLYYTKRARKKVYYIGVSIAEKRLAKNKDKVILLERFPEMENWVINSVGNYLSAAN